MRAHVFVGEPIGQQTGDDQNAQERLHAQVGEGQRRSALVADYLGASTPGDRRPHRGGNRG